VEQFGVVEHFLWNISALWNNLFLKKIKKDVDRGLKMIFNSGLWLLHH
jgi:hypothetical protein